MKQERKNKRRRRQKQRGGENVAPITQPIIHTKNNHKR